MGCGVARSVAAAPAHSGALHLIGIAFILDVAASPLIGRAVRFVPEIHSLPSRDFPLKHCKAFNWSQ